MKRLAIVLALCTWSNFAALPPELPGKEITQEYIELFTPTDSIAANPPKQTPESDSWFDKAMQTWDAPVLSEQIAKDQASIPLGKGALFIPTFSENNPNPSVEVVDINGKVVARGNVAEKINLFPGTYYAVFGTGSQEQKIVRSFTISEGKVTPLIPDWSSLIVDVVDINNISFRGEYDIIRLENLEFYGRQYGKDPDLGEELRTQVFRPGTYKIFEVGRNYNTLNGFITVRLLPAELTRVVLVQNPETFEIVSGGTVEIYPDQSQNSNWTNNLDIGGSINFNLDRNHQTDTVTMSAVFNILINGNLRFRKLPLDWENKFRINQGIEIESRYPKGGFSEADFNLGDNSEDEFRINSILVWRQFLSWLGPYARTNIETELFPSYLRLTQAEEDAKHYFVVFDDPPSYRTYNSASAVPSHPDSLLNITEIDSTRANWLVKPSFSPFNFDAGFGANFDINTPFEIFDIRARAGFGLRKVYNFSRSVPISYSDSIYHNISEQAANTIATLQSNGVIRVVQRKEDSAPLDFGPEAQLDASINAGRFGTNEVELRVFAPLERIGEPDFDFRNRISWRVTKSIRLEYLYKYQLQRFSGATPELNTSSHGIFLTYSFTNR